MTVRELFEYMRKLPDWDREVKLKVIENGMIIRTDCRAGVGDFTGDLYLYGYESSERAEECVDDL